MTYFQFIFSKSHSFPTCILHDKFVNISKLYYMSDGCATQYKNRNNFINLTYHFSDFGVLGHVHKKGGQVLKTDICSFAKYTSHFVNFCPFD